MIYADSSFIVSAYVEDDNSATARDFLEASRPRLPFAFLHWPEVAGNFFKFQLEPEKLWDLLKEDIAGGKKLFALELNAENVGRRAAGLMRHFGPEWEKLRSLDAMHVAAAIEAKAKTFLSFDQKSHQRILAAAQKLTVWPPLSTEEKERLKTW